MFTMVNFQISSDTIASIHKTGCPDIAKDVRAHDGLAVDGFATVQAAIDDLNADFVAEGSAGWPRESFKIPACATRREK